MQIYLHCFQSVDSNFVQSDSSQACMIYMKEYIDLIFFHASLWVDRGQNTVCPWQLCFY